MAINPTSPQVVDSSVPADKIFAEQKHSSAVAPDRLQLLTR